MISCDEFNRLMSLKKILKEKEIIIPGIGKKHEYDVISIDNKEFFMLSISRSTINVNKVTYQNLYKTYNIVIARIDLGGPRHLNPDGEFIYCPHIHIYKEGYGDKWAFSLPDNFFKNVNDIVYLLEDFLRYCNIEVENIIYQEQF